MTGPSSERTADASWFHEYGFSGGDDFESVVLFADMHGFAFVYGGATKKPEWMGYPAEYGALEERLAAMVARNQQLQEALEPLAEGVNVYRDIDETVECAYCQKPMHQGVLGATETEWHDADCPVAAARAALASVRARTPGRDGAAT